MDKTNYRKQVNQERTRLLRTINKFTDTPMLILGFIWLALLIVELLNRSNSTLNALGVVIWIIFIIDFVIKFFLSPSKIGFLRKNVITAISLILPAVRVLRFVKFLRLVRLSRSLRLVKVLGSLNRGMNSLSQLMQRRAFGYVIAVTLIVMFTGAAGAFAFEKNSGSGFESYGSALWRTAMLIMNMGTEWPVTTEGRALYFFIAIYSMAVLGYITATLASFFIGRDVNKHPEKGNYRQIDELRKEIILLREEIKKGNL